MTRVTNIGRKRTYLEAGFDSQEQVEASIAQSEKNINSAVPQVDEGGTTGEPPKKKRNRSRNKKNRNISAGQDSVGEKDEAKALTTGENAEGGVNDASTSSKVEKKLKKTKQKRPKALSDSEIRRQKRIAEKQAQTTCFACRQKGHAAKDCPVTQSKIGEDGKRIKATNAIGICYRCGSTKHTLSRCKKPVDQTNPLPFASCFVCSGKGHLASACPQNKAKGIYPNGGCCKLCGDTSHLAKDCGLRKQDVIDNTVMYGTGGDAGADEDDFHTFKRRTTEVDRDEKQEDRAKRLLDIKAGAHSGVVRSFGAPITGGASAKKVVYF